MRILHVIPSFAPAWRYGGPVHAAYEMCRELARQGADVTVYTTNIDGPDDLDVPLDRAVVMDGFRVRYFQVQQPRFYSFSMALARALKSDISAFDVVHVHSVFNWPITPAAAACRRHRVPYIVRPCGILDEDAVWKTYEGPWTSLRSGLKKSVYFQLLEKRNLEGASAIHFTSEDEARKSAWTGLRTPHFVCPLGVSFPDPMNGAGDSDDFESDKLVLLYLSRLDPKKGLDLLVPALSEVLQERDDAIFAVAGAGEPAFEREARDLVGRWGLGDRTLWFGAVEGDQKWRLLRRADIFVLPSYQENFGLAVVEAMAAGRAVLVSDRVGIHKEITRAGAGVVVPCDAAALRDALSTLIRRPDLRLEMGKRARELAVQRFGWPAIARQLLSVYQRVLNGEPVDGRPHS